MTEASFRERLRFYYQNSYVRLLLLLFLCITCIKVYILARNFNKIEFILRYFKGIFKDLTQVFSKS